jgi:hypothetical protein
LQRQWDPTVSNHSYGFRPQRSAHEAVARAQQNVSEGFGWVVDLDLEKFFDRVNHDKLMGLIAQRVEDKRLLKLIGASLNAGVMENGLVKPERGRNCARGTSFAFAEQPRAGRTRPRAGAAGPSIRSLCGRLQYLRTQRAGGSEGNGEHHAIYYRAAQAEGK